MTAPGLPLVMGIVNTTPDSFSDGGRWTDPVKAIDQAMRLVEQGADVLDIGGESTRPGAEPVGEQEEIERTAPLIEAIRSRWAGQISIDTMKPAVARAAMAAGARFWNDVTALTHAPGAEALAAELGCDVILMHMKGEPRTMQVDPVYGDVVAEVCAYLVERAEAAMAAGVSRDRIWLDPGIGFGKSLSHNLALTAQLDVLTAAGFPVLYAASRKRTIHAIDPTAQQPLDRLGGSIALALEGARRGAKMVRVHDVRETVQALKVQAALLGAA